MSTVEPRGIDVDSESLDGGALAAPLFFHAVFDGHTVRETPPDG
jgi:hypothetical protein